MQIKIYPDEIIKRCLWDSYVYYILGTEKEAQKILEENEEMIISERDALVIGLLKVIETDNLIHKFNGYIVEVLTNKSSASSGVLMIRTKVIDSAIDKFLSKFPEYWTPGANWVTALSDLKVYIEGLKEKVSKLEVHTITDRNITSDFYGSNNVKKLLKFNY